MSDQEVATLRANSAITGGGSVIWNADQLSWTNRFIVISNGRGAHFSTNGYYDINMPPSGTTVLGYGGAPNQVATTNGIPIPGWTALYYDLPIGSTNVSQPSRFRLVNYTSNFVVPDNWILLAVRNSDFERLLLNTDGGQTLAPGQRYVSSLGRTGTACTHNMTLFYSFPSFANEHSIRIADSDGNLYFQTTGTTNGSFSAALALPPGRYSVQALDSWGDGWNNGTFRIDSNADNGKVASVVLPTLAPLQGGNSAYCRTSFGANVIIDKCAQTTWIDVAPDCTDAYANQRTIHGAVNSNGTIYSGGGFSVSRFGTGWYQVSFSEPFMQVPAVVVSQQFGAFTTSDSGGNRRDNALTTMMTPTATQLVTGDGNGNSSDRNFAFIATGD
jgi:hypothetical protein